MKRACLAAIVFFIFCTVTLTGGEELVGETESVEVIFSESIPKEAETDTNSIETTVDDSDEQNESVESEDNGRMAIFGLSWGMTPTEVKELGTRLKPEKKTDNLYIYSANSLPNNLKDTGSYTLVFSKDGKLVKIIMLSKKFINDIYGDQGRSRFEELALELSHKYQEISSIMETGIKAYDSEDEFYQCLAYPGCGLWVKKFRGENKDIFLQMNGIKKGEGYISITVEAVPEWDFAREAKDSIIVVDDADAL